MAGPRAPLLVFAHYFGGSARSWAPLLASLDGRFESAAPDLQGFGGTAAPPHPSFDAYVDQLEAMAGQRPWIGVGHSFGGKIALAAAARRPPMLKGLILIAPSPPTPEPMTEQERQATIRSFADPNAAKAHLDAITHGSLPENLVGACVEDALRVAKPTWLWWLVQGSREDISDRTHGLDLPTLVIAGDKDTVLGPDTPFEVAAGLKRADVRVLSSGGHLLPLEQPAAVAQALRQFIASLAEDRA